MSKLSFPELPLDKQCHVIEYNECGIFAIHKATGVLSHPNPNNNSKSRTRSLLIAKYNSEKECYEWNDSQGLSQKFYLCHRLESPTSGVIIGALNPKVASLIKKEFSTRRIEKTYLAITEFNPRIKEGTWTDFLVEEKMNGKLGSLEAKAQSAKQILASFKEKRDYTSSIN